MLCDRGLDHVPPQIDIAHRGHGFVGLARRVEDGERLIDVLVPGAVDFRPGGAVGNRPYVS